MIEEELGILLKTGCEEVAEAEATGEACFFSMFNQKLSFELDPEEETAVVISSLIFEVKTTGKNIVSFFFFVCLCFWCLFFSNVIVEVLGSGRELLISFDNFVDGVKQVLLRNHLSSRSDCKHSSFRADAANIGTGAVWAKSGEELKSDIPLAVHALGVDSKDICSSIKIGQSEFNLSVKSSRSEEGRIESVRSVRRHENLDVSSRIESVKLVDNFEHCSLNFIVSSGSIVEARSSDGVDFVKENDGSLSLSGHLEELANHSRSFSDIFLNELGSNDANESRIGSVGNGTSKQRLSRSRRSVQKNSFGRIDSEGNKSFGLFFF